MNDGDISKQIQQMVWFIRQEAEEKANESNVSAKEVLVRKANNQYSWKGFQVIPKTLEDLKVSPESKKNVIVVVKQKNLLGTAFHPELTADTRWHNYFLKMVVKLGDGNLGRYRHYWNRLG